MLEWISPVGSRKDLVNDGKVQDGHDELNHWHQPVRDVAKLRCTRGTRNTWHAQDAASKGTIASQGHWNTYGGWRRTGHRRGIFIARSGALTQKWQGDAVMVARPGDCSLADVVTGAHVPQHRHRHIVRLYFAT